MAARHAGHAGTSSGGQQFCLFGILPLDTRYAGDRKLAQQGTVAAGNAGGTAEQYQLVGTDPRGAVHGNVLQHEVENFSGRRIAEGRQQHNGAGGELLLDAGAVDAPHPSGVLVVDPIHHTQWPGGDEIAGTDAHARTLHR